MYNRILFLTEYDRLGYCKERNVERWKLVQHFTLQAVLYNFKVHVASLLPLCVGSTFLIFMLKILCLANEFAV